MNEARHSWIYYAHPDAGAGQSQIDTAAKIGDTDGHSNMEFHIWIWGNSDCTPTDLSDSGSSDPFLTSHLISGLFELEFPLASTRHHSLSDGSVS